MLSICFSMLVFACGRANVRFTWKRKIKRLAPGLVKFPKVFRHLPKKHQRCSDDFRKSSEDIASASFLSEKKNWIRNLKNQQAFVQLTVVIQEETPEYIHCVKRITSLIICVESEILGTNKLQANYFLFIKEKFLAIKWRSVHLSPHYFGEQIRCCPLR